MEKPTPFINSSLLPNYRGQVVRIVGKVNKISASTLLIQTSDMGNVEVSLQQGTDLSSDARFVEVIGKVSDSGEQMREFTCTDVGENVDTNLVERVVNITSRPSLAAMFTGDGSD